MVPSTDQPLDLWSLLLAGAPIAAVVIAAALAFALGRATARRSRPGVLPASRRLAVVDSIALDQGRRLVLLRRDGIEHLVLIGGSSDVLVEADIERRTGQGLAVGSPGSVGRAIQDQAPARAMPGFAEPRELVRDIPLPRHYDAGPSFPRGVDAEREPLAAPQARAVTSPAVPEPRVVSPVPPRRSPASPGPVANRPVSPRQGVLGRTNFAAKVDRPAEETTQGPRRGSVATPSVRYAPPSQPEESKAPEEAQPAALDLEPASDSGAPAEAEARSVELPAEERPDDAPPAKDDIPTAEAAPSESQDITKVTEEAAAPEATPPASSDRDAIDRLEAEIARLLGRASSR